MTVEIESPNTHAHEGILDRFDRSPDGWFFVLLYAIRWPIVLPLAYANEPLARILGADIAKYEAMAAEAGANPVGALLSSVIFAPVVSVAIICALPYVIAKLFRAPSPRPWGYVATTAIIMVLIDPLFAVFPSAVTGAFLGYCYAHFAPRGQLKAYGWTVLYLAAINIVGWLSLAMGGTL
jgi:hypothetical protein